MTEYSLIPAHSDAQSALEVKAKSRLSNLKNQPFVMIYQEESG
jgi:hypothetical protein